MKNVIFTQTIAQTLQEELDRLQYDKLFVLTDETTHRLCLPILESVPAISSAQQLTIGCTDSHKTLETVSAVWTLLSSYGGSRHSLLVILGGGMVSDLGGFAASTFKRGIQYLNIPTTLLSMVDASVGGKTGINFNGLKNEIGVFSHPVKVLIDTIFLRTLDNQNLFSGYAEMLKHGLLSDREHLGELLSFDLFEPDLRQLGEMIEKSVAVKAHIVETDPTEQKLRKSLNLGHTVGHSFESFSLQHNPILHGYAVAWGLICELYLSCVKTGFPTAIMRQCVHFIKEHYGMFSITCDDYPTLYELMTHDKKNCAGVINFTLLKDVGEVVLDQSASREEIYEMLDFYRES